MAREVAWDPAAAPDAAWRRRAGRRRRSALWWRVSRRVARWPLARLLLMLNVVFAALVVLLLVVGAFGFQALSTIRAYQGGEALWADRVDRAVLDLTRYAATGDPAQYAAYRREIAVPLADRAARLELQQPRYNYQQVAADFAAGGNSPADSRASALMFRWFHDASHLRTALAAWAAADASLMRLQALGTTLHAAVSSGLTGRVRARSELARIHALNRTLQSKEDRFAATLGEAARWLTGVMLAVLGGAALLAVAVGGALCYLLWRMLRDRLERIRRYALRIAEGRLDRRVPAGVPDEVGRLGDTFNRMADALAHAWAEVEAKNRALLCVAHQERDLIMETVPDLIFVADAQGLLTRWNRHVERATGRSCEELAGHPVTAVFIDEERSLMSQALDTAARTGLAVAEAAIAGPDGRPHPFEWRCAPLHDGSGRLVGLAGAGRDIAERRVLERELTHRAFHDALTDLPNRALFVDRLERAVARAGSGWGSPAVLFVDLDRFKSINDTLGHDAGDRLLVAVGRRMASCLGAADTVARLGGDEFTVLLEHADERQSRAAAGRILAAVRRPFEFEGRTLFLSASVGISLVARPGSTSASDLLRRADLAMYEAKRAGRNRAVVSTEGMGADADERFALEHDLRLAPQRNELRVFYQPLVDLESGELIQVEALLRWWHPARGLLLPDAFIGLAEETGLIVPVGRWVLEESCRDAARWVRTGLRRPVTVCANLSAWQFRDPGLLGDVRRVLRETGLAPHRLKLEITETAVLLDEDAAVETLRRLRALGVRLAVDDFGVGYSSLQYLKRLPLDEIKIDRSFVTGVDRDPQDAAIVRSVVRLARELRLRVTAEGIESAAVLHKVRSLGCQRGQGFYLGEPLPAAEAARALCSPGTGWTAGAASASGS